MATAPSRINHQDITIGTLAPMDKGGTYLSQVVEHGFESFELTCWQYLGGVDLKKLSEEAKEALGDQAIISSLGIYGNPLTDEKTAADWETVIKGCKYFGCDVVCGFAGALEDRPVDESMEQFGKVFGKLAKIAEDEGVRIAFENCDMGGSWDRPRWNIAHAPRAWEMMFNAVPGTTLGLEWEPCHQMGSLIDPIPQLRKWVDRVYHVHGKDATVAIDILETEGTRSGKQWIWHRTPGFGDSNWSDIITILRQANFVGAIDIEGWHDPIYCGDLEMTGQVYGLEYLLSCRGGQYIPNPV